MSKMPPAGFIIFLLLFAGCSSVIKESEIPVIDIVTNINNFQFVSLSEFTDDIEYIPLETGDSNLLRSIAHLVVTDDRFIISDSYSCMAFNREGKFICTYGSKGNGPGQYTFSIEGISIDKENQRVYLSTKPEKIIEFSYDGTFLREIAIPDLFSKGSSVFYTLGNNIFCGLDRSSGAHKMLLFDDQGEIYGKYPNYFVNFTLDGNILDYIFASNSQLIINDKILYKDALCDTVFYLDRKDLHRQPAYCFDFGEYSITAEDIASERVVNNFYSVTKFIEINNFLLFTFTLPISDLPESEIILRTQKLPEGVVSQGNESNPIRCMFNKLTSETIFLKKTEGFESWYDARGMVNDIDGGLTFWPDFQPYGNTLVKAVDAYRIKNYIESEEFKKSNPEYPEKKKELEQLAASLDYEDNPVLMIVRLRQE